MRIQYACKPRTVNFFPVYALCSSYGLPLVFSEEAIVKSRRYESLIAADWARTVVAGIASTLLASSLALLGSSVALADDAAPAAAPAAAPTAGSWQTHKYSFQFMGFTSTYSCDGLADKLKKLLIASGARSDVKSQPGACASGFGRPDKFARADLTFYTLAPVDATAATAGKTVSGVWRSVVLSTGSPHELGIGDCELVEQFRSQVLPMFTTRAVVNNTSCIPHQDSGSTISLTFDSFAALPMKKPAPGATGGG
jgi:hypothetical protein